MSKKTKSNSNDEEKVFDLGNNRKVTVQKFKNKVFVNIREFYDAGGELKPGKKGSYSFIH